jgi:hypothetical protein
MLVYLLTPYMALGFGQDSCTCTVDGVVCGTDGFICACCFMNRLSHECSEAGFSRCHMKNHSDPHSQPPAVNESFVEVDGTTVYADNIAHFDYSSIPGFKFFPLKPPRIV